MDEEALVASIRKFLRTVGVQSQREIEQAVQRALADGRIAGDDAFAATMTLRVPALDLEVTYDGELRLN